MRIQANGISIGYDLDGPSEAPVVTMSHSLAANRDMWWPQTNELQKNHRVLRYDTRGHGESDATKGPYSISLLVNDVVSLLDELDIKETHFVGLSMGGMIGQLLAANHPDRLLSLTLCATACRMAPEMEPVWDERIKSANQNGMASIAETTIERWFTHPYRISNATEVERILQMIKNTPVKGFEGCSQAIKILDQLQCLKRITAPTLILVGANDPSTPPTASETIQKHIVGSVMTVITNASHLLNVEQATHFNEQLFTFLKGRTGA